METDKVNQNEMKIEKESLLLRYCKSVRGMKIEKKKIDSDMEIAKRAKNEENRHMRRKTIF